MQMMTPDLALPHANGVEKSLGPSGFRQEIDSGGQMPDAFRVHELRGIPASDSFLSEIFPNVKDHYLDGKGNMRKIYTAIDAAIASGLPYHKAIRKLDIVYTHNQMLRMQAEKEMLKYVVEPSSYKSCCITNRPPTMNELRASLMSFMDKLGDTDDHPLRFDVIVVDPNTDDNAKDENGRTDRKVYPVGKQRQWIRRDFNDPDSLLILRHENANGRGILAIPAIDLHVDILVLDDVVNPNRQNPAWLGSLCPDIYMQTSPYKSQALFVLPRMDGSITKDGHHFPVCGYINTKDGRLRRDKEHDEEYAARLQFVQRLNRQYGDPGLNSLRHAFRLPGFRNTKNAYADDHHFIPLADGIAGNPIPGKISPFLKTCLAKWSDPDAWPLPTNIEEMRDASRRARQMASILQGLQEHEQGLGMRPSDPVPLFPDAPDHSRPIPLRHRGWPKEWETPGAILPGPILSWAPPARSKGIPDGYGTPEATVDDGPSPF
jgi:hypothetical protein